MGTHLSILLFSGLWGCQLKAELGGDNLASIRPLTSGQMQGGTPPPQPTEVEIGRELDWHVPPPVKTARVACLRSHSGLTAMLAACPSAQTLCQALPLNTGDSASAWPYLSVCVWCQRKESRAALRHWTIAYFLVK